MEEFLLPFRLTLGEELLCKGTRTDDDGQEIAEFEGVVSTEHQDVQGDIVIQKGVNWSHFRQNGVFDWEHSTDPKDIIGVPTEVRENIICKGVPGTYVKGKLLLAQPRAREVLNLMKSLVGTDRQMGFSVMGKGLRDPLDKRKIVKSFFSRIAFTVTPVNPFTGGGLVTVAKSLEWAPAPAPSYTKQQVQQLCQQAFGDRATPQLVDAIFARAQALDGARAGV